MKFTDLKLNGKTVKSIHNFGYTEATDVQEKAIPQILSGNNLIVRSQTGTGKTAAFGIGLMERIVAGKTTKALILTPTRELAVQVCAELRGISQVHQLTIHSVYGGQSINTQIHKLKKRYDILVATPGRLLDLCRRKKVDLSEFDTVVLDEADHMLDLGFQREVLGIMDSLPKEKLVLLFSATIDQSIRKIASKYMPDSETITIGEIEIVSSIKEENIHLPHAEKLAKLIQLLNSHRGMKSLVFARTRRGVGKLKRLIEKRGFERIGMLQGDMPQSKRIKVLTKFRENQLSILVATDVASRGLHIDDVGLVVNYDRADTKKTHLHRVGRTGRMGAEGKVVNFISDDEPLVRRKDGRRGAHYSKIKYKSRNKSRHKREKKGRA